MTNFVSTDPLNNLTNLYQRPLFIAADRAPRDITTYPTSADIQPPGTQWQDNSVIPPAQYETIGGGEWNEGNTNNIDEIIPDTGSNVVAIDGMVKIQGQYNISTDGANANTLLLSVSGTTNHAVQVGNSTGSLTSVSPSATSGIPLVSQGSSADPTFAISVVAGGGTGSASFTNVNSVLFSGATSTGNFQAPATGASGTVLTSNGIGVLPTWQANTSLSRINYQIFQTPGTNTYTPTAGMTFCIITCVGAGGAGGGSATSGVGNCTLGGGGGGGENAVGEFSVAQIGASQTVTIGAAGVGNSGTTGGNGGASSVGVLITSNGGTGGQTGTSGASSAGNGGLGGTGGTGGDYRSNGASGLYGWGANVVGAYFGGQGASSSFGAGGGNNTTVNSNGIAASGYGSGGGGANNGGSASAFTGGNGTPGIVVIQEFINL